MKKFLFLIFTFTIILAGIISPPAKAQEQPQKIQMLIDGLPASLMCSRLSLTAASWFLYGQLQKLLI